MVLKYISQGAGFMDNIDYNVQDLETLDSILALNNVTIIQAVEYFHQPCSELIFRCSLEYKIQPCELLFQETMTYHGICCSFNAVKVRNRFVNEARYV